MGEVMVVKVIRRLPFVGLLLLKVVDVSFNYCYFGPTSCYLEPLFLA